METAEKHFGLTFDEACDLFETTGCGLAKTPVAAAEYIEAFAARKWPGDAT
jgi:hypothetical protein